MGNKRDALRKIMKKIPEGDMISHILEQGGPGVKNPAWDRTAAITGASFLEYALRKAICMHFKADHSDPEFNYIFENGEAPYRELAGRSRLAKALGIISKEEFLTLETIRHIRNGFAHTMAAIDFDTPEIVDYCKDLPREFPGHPVEDFPINRQNFVVAVIQLYLKLIHHTESSNRGNDDPLPTI